MAFKPSYLVHWSGKDICTNINNLTNEDRNKYLQRLENIINEGLWVNNNYDQIDTSYTTTSGYISPGQLYYAQNITCFTELKISSSYQHTMKYGLLGVGYSRKFILSNGGRPVHYYSNQVDDPLSISVVRLLGFIQKHDPYATFGDIESPMTYLNNIIGFIKPIASKDELETYIDEAEWRIKATIEKPHNKYFRLLNPMNHEKPFGKLVFPLDEIKIIILPDKGTRQLLYQSKTFKSVFETMEDSPLIISFEELQEL